MIIRIQEMVIGVLKMKDHKLGRTTKVQEDDGLDFKRKEGSVRVRMKE